MMRGIEEWNRHAVPAVRDPAGNIVTPGHDPYGGTGEWSFRRNADAIKAYWPTASSAWPTRTSRAWSRSACAATATSSLPDGDGIELMQEILAHRAADPRRARRARTSPQVWTLYKEVQRYWDQGLRAPDDVTVVFTDDNWGNMRKLPDPTLPPRAGGYGMYYHFDYVGGGRNYKWVDTINLANTWEQLNTSLPVRRRPAVGGQRRRPEERGAAAAVLPRLRVETRCRCRGRLPEWEKRYAAENFGAGTPPAIAEVLHTYGVLQSRRKPELLNRRITSGARHHGHLRRPGQPVLPGELPGDGPGDRGLAAPRGRGRSGSGAPCRRPTRTPTSSSCCYAGQGDREPVRVAARGVHEHPVRRTGPGRDQRPRRRDGRAVRRRPGAVALLQHRARRREVAELPDPAEDRLRRHRAVRPERAVAAAGAEQRGAAGRGLPRRATDRRCRPAADMGVAVDGSDQWWPAATRRRPCCRRSARTRASPAQYLEVFNRGATPFDYRIRPASRG